MDETTQATATWTPEAYIYALEHANELARVWYGTVTGRPIPRASSMVVPPAPSYVPSRFGTTTISPLILIGALVVLVIVLR